MGVVGWLVVAAALLSLTMAWWIVVPFYLGSYSNGPKPATGSERAITLVAGVLLTAAWNGVLKSAPFFSHSN